MVLLFLESIGTTELLLILVVALVVFGPRKLPELARTLGKSLNDFKRASDDFKRTWEREVELENHEGDRRPERAMLAEPAPETAAVTAAAAAGSAAREPVVVESAHAVARGTPHEAAADLASADSASADSPAVTGDAHAHAEGVASGAEQRPRHDAPAEDPAAKPDWL